MKNLLLQLSNKIDSFFYDKVSRIPALDGVRTIAVTLVIMRHCFDRPLKAIHDIPMIFQYIMSLGWVGVHLFFVLSGFLIGGGIYKTIRDGNFSFRRFYIKRFFRIIPVAFALLLILHKQYIGFNFGTISNFLFISNYTNTGWTAHYWSLNVEEHFYVIFPILFLILYRIFWGNLNRILIALLSIITVSWIFRYYIVVINPIRYLFASDPYTISHWQIDYFLLGVLGAILYINNLIPKNRLLSILLWMTPVFYLILAIITAQISPHTPLSNQNPVNIALLAPFYAILCFLTVILTATQKNLLTVFFSSPGFKWISILSYSMYLWHLFIIEKVLVKIPIPQLSSTIMSMVVFLIVYSLTILISIISYRLFEKPFLILRDKILSK